MGAPRRFLDGVTNVSSSDPLGQLPYLDPTKWHIYYEGFESGPFSSAVTGAGAGTSGTGKAGGFVAIASTNAVTVNQAMDTNLSCLKIITTATDNAYGHVYSGLPGLNLVSGKKFIMETYFEITHTAGNIDQNEWFIGLASAQTGTGFWKSTARTFDDGIGWYSYDGDTDFDLIVGENDVFDNVTVKATYATATWYRASVYYDGTDCYCYLNDDSVAKLTPSAIPVSAVGPCFFLQTGEAKVHQLLVDYLFVARER